ncbi:MAG TPA: TadE family type IV pilus minor pilin [Propionicimonas sp.]|jgi:hypothetical protein|nr:TadE family type IV pilus minor pilin [Propionicimonas sp.]
MVTAELALGMLFVAAATAVAAWVVTVLGVLVQCQDAAAEVARQEARGDTVAAARARADRPPDSRVSITRSGRSIEVTVQVETRPWADWLPAVPLKATAIVLAEDG